MKFKIKLLALPLFFSINAYAAYTTYSFDTVTSINLHSSSPSIQGIEKDTGNEITVSFKDITNVSYRYVVNRCVPVFLTVMDKPGKYFLNLTIDPNTSSVGLKSCEIKLKS